MITIEQVKSAVAGTHQDNMDDMMSKGRGIQLTGSKHGMSKLTETNVSEIKKRLSEGEQLKSIGDSFGVTKQNIWCIKMEKTWAHTT